VNDGEYSVSDDVGILISRPLAQQTLIAKGASWKYLDNGSNQNTAWRGVTFADTSWASGPAPLGYGDPVATTVDFGISTAKYVTTYLRHSFNLASARNVVSLVVSLMRDDGAIVYLNGTEIFRSNMPEGAVDYLTPASNVVGGGDETTFFDQTVDPALLRDGQNVIAVELHQQNGTSTDLSFDLQLSGMVNFSNQPPTANAGADSSVQLPVPQRSTASPQMTACRTRRAFSMRAGPRSADRVRFRLRTPICRKQRLPSQRQAPMFCASPSRMASLLRRTTSR
jgi:hypothetical protein